MLTGNWFKDTARMLGLFVFIHLTQVLVSAAWLWGVFFDHDRAWKSCMGYDRFANAAYNGDPKETISSRAGRGEEAGSRGWCILCRFLDLFEKDHCKKAKGF